MSQPGIAECDACRGTGFVYRDRDTIDGAVYVDGAIVEGHRRQVIRCPHVVALLERSRMTCYGHEYAAAASLAELTPVDIADAAAGFVLRPKTPGMLICGGVGCGKSYLASAIVNARLQSKCRVVFATIPLLFQAAKRALAAGELEPLTAEAMNCDLLILDDLGAEKPSEWTEELLYTIVADRWGRRAAVIATTNLKLSKLEQVIGERTLDRLMGFCGGHPLLMKGPSRRWARS